MIDDDMPRYIVADGEIYDHQIQRWPSKLEILETLNQYEEEKPLIEFAKDLMTKIVEGDE